MATTRDRRVFIAIWLATAVLVAVGAILIYHFATRVDALAGRPDPADLYSDPALLLTDPGILGSAVEVQVTEAVRECMAEAGYDYRGPAVVADLDSLLDPATDGYGIAGGPAAPLPQLGAGGPGGDQSGYEEALYGSSLAGADGAAGGCAAAGRAALDRALAALEAMPYPIEQFEADAAAHPSWVAALGEWSACMAERGYSAASPEDLIASLEAALALASGDDARAVAERERATAAADFACREATLDPALEQVADDLAPAFVDRNRTQLEAIIPPPGGTPSDEGLGTGDVQVTLRWGSTVDLDLAVIDPAGARIDYSSKTSASGGQLDHDANYPCETGTGTPVENVFWPPGGAPAGHYVVTVTFLTGCGSGTDQPFQLIIRLDGEVAQEVSQAINPGSPLTFEFDYGGSR
ncbi:MAG: hypothetical protein H6R33_461 [Actinobacteria bacterium]|nr:hypothetical protein [Actinomycetota bacterium]